jgi:DNA-binding SARP family transcriptional activator
VRFEITLAGDVTIRRDDQPAGLPLRGANPPVAAALLTLEHAQGVSRERLADALWPGGLPATWDSALRTAISRVRSWVIAVLPPGAANPVEARGGRYLLLFPAGADVVVDVELAERSVAEAGRALGRGDATAARRLADDAAERLRPPFLSAHHGDWVDEQRDRLSELSVVALETASRAAALAGEAAAALAAADEAVQRAPLRESAHRCRMAAHAAGGNRAEALRAYQRLRRVLADELGVDPAAETEAAYLELLGPAPPARQAAEPRDRGPSPPPPFVGRESELGVLAAAWDRAAAGARHVVVVTGEAGIGKTRLTTEAARQVSADGGLVLFGRCDQEAIVPYQPVVEALDGYFAATPPDELPTLDDAARAELAAVLPSTGGPRRVGEPGGRAALFDAVTALVASAARERPVLLVLDDLQWADSDTLLLLRHLLRRAGDAPILVVAISRDHDVEPGNVLGDVVHALDREGWVRRLPLRGLDESDVRALIQQSEEGPTDAPTNSRGGEAALARRLVVETAGNPFLVTEVLRAGTAAGEPIPQGVQDLVATRVARLDGAALDLVRAAAVAGVRFDLDLAAAAAGLDGQTALDALDAAIASGLMVEETAERYRFPHDIVRRTVVTQLSGARRRALHSRLTDAIETHRSDRTDAYVAALAHHSSAGATPGGDRRAVAWSRAAAAHAAEQNAPSEAVRLSRQALSHVPVADGGLRAEVLIELGAESLAAGEPSGERTLFEGATLAREHARIDVLARAALALAERAADNAVLRIDAAGLVDAALEASEADPGAAGPLLHARLLARQFALDERRAPGPASAGRAHPPQAALTAVRQRLAALGGPDHLDERLDLARDLTLLADAAGDRSAHVVAAHEQAMVAALAGDDDLLQATLQVLDKAATEGDGQQAFVAAMRAERRAAEAAMAGEFHAAGAAVGAAVDAHRELGVEDPAAVAARHLTVVRWMRGATAEPDAGSVAPASAAADPGGALAGLGRGDRDRARSEVRDLVTGARALPAGDEHLHALGLLALAAGDLGQADLIDDVRALVAPHADLTCGMGYRTFAGTAAFHLGRLAALAGDWGDAERHTLAALRRHTALRARPWVAVTQSVLADVLEGRGRPSDREWVAALRAEAGWVSSTLGLRSL